MKLSPCEIACLEEEFINFQDEIITSQDPKTASSAYIYAQIATEESISFIDISTLESFVLKFGNANTAYLFAENIYGADIKALEKRVLDVGTALEVNLFLRNIPGADKSALQARILQIRDESESQILASGTATEAYLFALQIPGANVNALLEKAKSLGYPDVDSIIEEMHQNRTLMQRARMFCTKSLRAIFDEPGSRWHLFDR